MLGRTDRRLRMVALLLIFAIFGSAAMLRLGYWQVVAAPDLAMQALSSMTVPESIKLTRADIVDRDGVVLAQSAFFDRLDVHPKDIKPEYREGIVETLTPILGLDTAEQAAYRTKLSSDRPWDWLERRISQEQSVEIRLARDQGKLPGIALEPLEVRRYPRKGGQGGTSLGSHLLGFVAGDGIGGYGVERLYDDRLTGRDTGSLKLASIAGVDLDLRPADDEFDVPPLELTIDAKLQRQLESELSTARIADKAKSASAIVMNAHTGAILASASVPGYDANDFATVAQDSMGRLRNPIVSEVFEPGSVMKIFTATAALQRGAVTPQTKIKDEGKMEFYKHTIHNNDKRGLGPITVKEVIARSRNVGTAKIAQRLAPNDTQKAARQLYDLWKRVGLVGKTGVDIANEEGGIYWDPSEFQWAPVDLANRAFGQGVAVTLVQLATGFSTVVNGGFRVQPHVVAEGEAAQAPRQRVLKSKVAHQAQDILVHVTGSVPWYARGSLVPGYVIGGKTGTAQIWDPTIGKSGDWKKNRFNHNFVGFVGTNRPEVVIAVRIEEATPKKSRIGVDLEIESYELFQMIARGAVKHLGMKRSKDKEAGLPILGTEAAKVLTPDRHSEARKHEKKQQRQEARRRKAERAERADRADRAEARSERAEARSEPSDSERVKGRDRRGDRGGGQGARSSGTADT